MCNMDKPPSWVVPIRLVLILSICLVSLLAHSFTGCNRQAVHSGAMELIEDGEKHDLGQPAGADSVILPDSSGGMNPQRLPPIVSPARLVFTTLSSLPLLRPPIPA